MKLVPLKLVTIIAIDALEQKIISDIKQCGSKGYTISEVEGEGIHSKHFSDWEGRNIKIETLVKEEVANKILEIISSKYFGKFSIVCFLSTVEVLRPEKFE
jgi:nitrogen regulatory protein P-II 2